MRPVRSFGITGRIGYACNFLPPSSATLCLPAVAACLKEVSDLSFGILQYGTKKVFYAAVKTMPHKKPSCSLINIYPKSIFN